MRHAFARPLSLGLLAAALAAAPASANPFPPKVWSCYHNDSATVLGTDRDQDVGMRFQIRKSTADIKADCLIEPRPGDVVIGEGDTDALYYIALAKTLLILDSGTGPDRGLVIYDVPAGKQVFSGGYSIQSNSCAPTAGCESEEFQIDEAGLTFWRELPEKANAKNCPGYAKFMKSTGSAAIEEKSLFRFATMKVESLKSRRCVQQQ